MTTKPFVELNQRVGAGDSVEVLNGRPGKWVPATFSGGIMVYNGAITHICVRTPNYPHESAFEIEDVRLVIEDKAETLEQMFGPLRSISID